jgi:ubiquinone/menaquinone biosynthesis C-methylase UbiE
VLDKARPSWQLPAGVSRGTWDYVCEPSIAELYDGFHAGHPLLEFDQQIVQQHLSESGLMTNNESRIAIDFGCGTGRNLLPLAAKSWRVVGVDLSQSMLTQFQSKLQSSMPNEDRVSLIRGNMVSLDFFSDGFADAVLCMYSSMGMIHGCKNRLTFLKHVARILSPGGLFFVHVHNRGSWLRDPGGVRRSISDWLRSCRDAEWEMGDRIYPYRGLPSMYLHVYSERELRRDLANAGLVLQKLYRLNRHSSGTLGNRWWLPHVRSGGFLAVCGAGSKQL